MLKKRKTRNTIPDGFGRLSLGLLVDLSSGLIVGSLDRGLDGVDDLSPSLVIASLSRGVDDLSPGLIIGPLYCGLGGVDDLSPSLVVASLSRGIDDLGPRLIVGSLCARVNDLSPRLGIRPLRYILGPSLLLVVPANLLSPALLLSALARSRRVDNPGLLSSLADLLSPGLLVAPLVYDLGPSFVVRGSLSRGVDDLSPGLLVGSLSLGVLIM